MPELPEVETTRRGVNPFLAGQTITDVVVRERRLRWPLPPEFESRLAGAGVSEVRRRAKYLLVPLVRGAEREGAAPAGTLLAHLGMSGSLRVVPASTPPRTHDHVDLVLSSGQCLRLHDPRRFGCLIWIEGDPTRHPLLRTLGPEPLSDAFDGAWLAAKARGRSGPVKCFLMDAHIVVGVGNIYANEALWRAGIDPRRAAGRIAAPRFDALATAVKTVLAEAIAKGGTTLRDFVQVDGSSGYFSIELEVYGRGGEPCPRCRKAIRVVRVGQRSTFFCTGCQR
ncbi:MAG: bifunctional DNA-formamidopyrimidine glycosylase/DNA-(apurinic or apyrimidinic site) lyase [Planctomycetes bacterium]|nr:bifunctional DNA-formamidopyrimidine glycosylase/DNA-(apurinic or apyrimidinic site) lyase [Planctomycetota bacterium]